MSDLSEDAEFARFREAAGRGNMVPLDARLFSDQLTPVTAYRTLVAADDREAPSFLFESVVNGTQTVRSASPHTRALAGMQTYAWISCHQCTQFIKVQLLLPFLQAASAPAGR